MSKLNHPELGCSQGRLILPYNGELQCFPKDNWIEEFELASSCSLNYIELLAERIHNPNNPIWSEKGLNSLSKTIKKNSLSIYSSCLDYIINNSLFSNDDFHIEVINYVEKFISKMSILGNKLIILPLLEKSDPTQYSLNKVVETMSLLVGNCEKKNISIAIESVAPSDYLLKVLQEINSPFLGCVYDTGNRFEIANPVVEILELSKYIFHVHIKDKRNSQNVQLGTGQVDFISVFKALIDISYNGAFNFETNRGIDPIITMKHNIEYINYIMRETTFI